MKSIKAGLLDNVVTTYGDTTKTFVTSKINTKTISGKSGLGAPFNAWAPVFDDSAGAPSAHFLTSNNRLFVINAIAAGVGRVSLYDFNAVTGVFSYIGGLNLTFINSPATTHTIRAFKVDDGANSSVVTGWRIFIGTTGSVTANGGLYMAMSVAKTDFVAVPTTLPTATTADSKQVYKLENSPFTLTQNAGIILQTSTTRVFFHNGVSATHQYAKFNYSISTGTPGANGVTTALFEFITGNLPALSGTLLLTNSEFRAVPQASPNPAGLLGFDCAFFVTGTTAYMGLLSELTNGATTWPSLQTSNFVTPLLFVNPTIISACWSNDLDRMVCNITNQCIVKPMQTNNIEYFMGGVDSQYYEAGGYLTQTTVRFAGLTSSQLQGMSGWIFLILSTAGQRGIVGMPLQSDFRYVTDYIITKVLDTPQSAFIALSRIRLLVGNSGVFKIQYRTSGFASQTAGWTDVPLSDDSLDGISNADQIQFRLLPRIASGLNTHTDYLNELYLLVQSVNEISDNWEYSKDQSDSGSPTRCAFRLKTAFASTVPTEYFRAYDLTGVLVASKNTVADASLFEYSTNNGSSWNSLGTVPNVIGTLLRFNFATPPGVDIRPSLREA